MAYFAQIDDFGIVQQVIAIDDSNVPGSSLEQTESLGKTFISDVLGLSGLWIQTCDLGSFRKQKASIGWRYDLEADVFVAPSPLPSWILDDNYDWQPPVPRPTDDGSYRWDEESMSWVPFDPS